MHAEDNGQPEEKGMILLFRLFCIFAFVFYAVSFKEICPPGMLHPWLLSKELRPSAIRPRPR